MRRHLVRAAALLLFVSCTHRPTPEEKLLAAVGFDESHLVQELAQNTMQIGLLEKLQAGERDAVVEMLHFELDARVLVLVELLDFQREVPFAEENRNLIACHLQAIQPYRTKYPSQTQYPEMKPCSERTTPGSQQAGARSTRGCSSGSVGAMGKTIHSAMEVRREGQ